MFEKEYKLNLTGKEETYVLLPLNGKYIGKFFKVVKALSPHMSKDDASAADITKILGSLDEEIITTLHELSLETLKKSYPNRWSPEDLDAIASKNVLTMIGPLFEINMPIA